MFKVGDPLFGGKLVIAEISNNYRKFVLTTPIGGDATGPMTITFDSNQTEDDINALLQSLA